MQCEYDVGTCSHTAYYLLLATYCLLLTTFGSPGFATYLVPNLLEARDKVRLYAGAVQGHESRVGRAARPPSLQHAKRVSGE